MERRNAERYFSEELCKFKVRAKINEIVFNGFIFDISETGVGVVGQIQDESSISTAAKIDGHILSPDEKRKFHIEGTVVRKDFISHNQRESLILGIKFAVRISLPDYIAMWAEPVGIMVD